MTPEAFAARITEWGRGTMIGSHGTRFVSAGQGRARMGQWETIVVPAGTELTLRNASEEPTVVMLTLAPPPAPGI